MRFQVLGPVEAVRDLDHLDLGGARQRAVLARLLITPGEVVAVDRLIDDLWDGAPTASALGVVQAYVSNLRRVLEPDRAPRTSAHILVTRAPGYALVGRTDAQEFSDQLAAGVRAFNAGDAEHAAHTLDRALALWRGAAYAEFADEGWARPEAARLTELLLVAREHRHAAALSLGDARSTVPALEQLVVEHPLREGYWRLLALSLYRTGRQADALQALRRARQTLVDELGLDPSPALRELEEAILVQSEAIGATAELALPVALPVTPHVIVPAATTADAASTDRDAARSPVIGRDIQLNGLRAAAMEARNGQPRTVLVSGEPGIGKTWLVDAFAAELRADGWRTVWGRCHDTSGAPALWPWLQVLGELDADRALPAELHRLIDEDGSQATDRIDAGDARFRQHESIRRYLLTVAQAAPLLVVLDDIQWADIASIQLLADAVTMSRAGRLLVVLATRETTDVPRAHTQALVRLDRAGGHRIPLRGLDATALQRLAEATGHRIAGSRLHERTGGNPLFVRETLRLVDTAGPENAFAQVPDSIADLVRQRLRRLPPESQTVLQASAVLGREVDIDVLIPVSAQPETEVWDALDAAVLTGVLVENADGHLRFAHDLVRETLYTDLAPLRRSRLHAQALGVLERRAAIDVSRLAEHAHAAGPVARQAATRWSIAAARQAGSRLAYEDAARWWRRAVDSHERDAAAEPSIRVELLMSLLRAQLDAGDAIGGRETRNQAVLAADLVADGQPSSRALVALDAPALWLLRQFDEIEFGIVERMESTLAALPDEDSEIRCRVLAALATELYGGARDPRCDEYSAHAVAMARRLGDPRVLAVALNARYLSMNREMIPDESVTAGHELVALGEEHSWPDVALLGHLLLASALMYRGDLSAADQHAESGERLNRRLNLQLPHMQSLSYRASRLQLDGRFAEAARVIEDFAELRLTWWAFDGLVASMRLTHQFLSGEVADAPDELFTAAAAARPSLAHDCRLIRDARAGLTPKSPPLWPEPVRDWGWLAMMLVRAEAASLVGDEGIRAKVYRDLLPFAGRISYSSAFAAPVDWYLAGLASSLGDRPAAARHLAALTAACIRESMDWWGTRARETQLGTS